MLAALRDKVHEWRRQRALQQASRRQWAFCTIATQGFLPHAKVLFDSIRGVHPEARLVLLFVGNDAGDSPAPEWEGVRVVRVRDLVDGEEERRLRRRYTVPEFCFALKPRLLLHAIDRVAERCIYLDSDILAYSRFDDVFVALERASIVLTPHLDTPLPDDGRLPSDLTISRSGAFNLGFVAAAATAKARAILQWWDRRVQRWGFVAPEAGYQGDQKWMDLAVGLFPDIGIVRDPGYNVAYWNMHSRYLAATESGITVQGVPLVFFHFSGYDPSQPERLSRFTNRIWLEQQPVARKLVQDYMALLEKARSGMASPASEAASPPAGTPQAAGTVAPTLLAPEAYKAHIVVESTLGVVETMEEVALRVSVTNTSACAWPAARGDDPRGGIYVGWHLRRDTDELVQWESPRFAFSRDLPPGESETLEVVFRAPASPGKYVLEFDLLHEGLTWFAERGSEVCCFRFGVGAFLEDWEGHKYVRNSR